MVYVVAQQDSMNIDQPNFLSWLGYRPSYAVTDLWIKDCGDHYEYIATYVDDILAFSKDPLAVIKDIQKDYTLKGIGAPEYYLGGNIEYLSDAWNKIGIKYAMSARTYINNMIEKMEKMFGYEIKTFKTPMHDSYHPELDDTPLVDARDASKYRGIVGSCNWVITLGRFDINYATQVMS